MGHDSFVFNSWVACVSTGKKTAIKDRWRAVGKRMQGNKVLINSNGDTRPSSCIIHVLMTKLYPWPFVDYWTTEHFNNCINQDWLIRRSTLMCNGGCRRWTTMRSQRRASVSTRHSRRIRRYSKWNPGKALCHEAARAPGVWVLCRDS